MTPAQRASIICWLLGRERTRLEAMPPQQLALARQGMDYRYRILRQRYLGMSPARAYRNLIDRLGALVSVRNKILAWIALSRDRQRALVDVLQEVIQEMLNSDRHLQGQMAWIAQCTQDEPLRNSLLFATLEEYCLRPIRNQPLMVYRFVNFLRRSQRGGMTQVPQNQKVRLLSEELDLGEADSPVSLLDSRAIALHQEEQAWEEQQALRLKVQEEFEAYLAQKVGDEACRWLGLYLQGRSQDAIAQEMGLPVRQVYRLREKVGYHAIQGFALKGRPELVASWLEISLKEQNLGLTPVQWQAFWQQLTPVQRQILEGLKACLPLEAIAQELNWKKSQVMGEWSKLYLAAQTLRNQR